MQGYYDIYGGVMYDMYVTYILCVSLAACQAHLVAHKLPYLDVSCKINLS